MFNCASHGHTHTHTHNSHLNASNIEYNSTNAQFNTRRRKYTRYCESPRRMDICCLVDRFPPQSRQTDSRSVRQCVFGVSLVCCGCCCVVDSTECFIADCWKAPPSALLCVIVSYQVCVFSHRFLMPNPLEFHVFYNEISEKVVPGGGAPT